MVAGVAAFSGATAAATHNYCTDQTAPAVVGSGSYETYETQYCEVAGDLDNTTTELNGTIADFEEGEGDLESAQETLTTFKSQHGALKDAETRMVSALIEETASGEVAGGFSAMQTLSDDSEQRTESVTAAADNYQRTLENHQSGPKLTVQLSLFGSLAGGVLVGVLIGAALPVKAARRIENKMRLSRDVSYDKKVAAIPAIIGVILAVAGIIVLYQFVGFSDLLVVVR